eukprot:6199447-Pleurochrysis_carterae.AAC.1
MNLLGANTENLGLSSCCGNSQAHLLTKKRQAERACTAVEGQARQQARPALLNCSEQLQRVLRGKGETEAVCHSH